MTPLHNHKLVKLQHNTNKVSLPIDNPQEETIAKRKVSFSLDPPTVHEYEPEYDALPEIKSACFFDDGWPGRAKQAMTSDSFMDFKARIEAKLSATNSSSLMIELNQSSNSSSSSPLLSNSLYKHKKNPLVQSLELCPETETDGSDSSSSPSNESPITTPVNTMNAWINCTHY